MIPKEFPVTPLGGENGAVGTGPACRVASSLAEHGTVDAAALRKWLRDQAWLQETLGVSPTAFRLLARQRVAGRFFGATLTTVFQPLRVPGDGRVFAHEALARSYSARGDGLSPWRLFADAASDEHLVTLDRLCRTVHALNYRVTGLNDVGGHLFLNVHERL